MNASGTLSSEEQVVSMDGESLAYLESLYETFLDHPESLSSYWRDYFSGLRVSSGADRHDRVRARFRQWSASSALPQPSASQSMADPLAQKAQALVQAYRSVGHQAARLDPLNLCDRPPMPALDPSFHGVSAQDLETPVAFGDFLLQSSGTMRQLRELLASVYCGTLGVEYTHISDPEQQAWLRAQIESSSEDFNRRLDRKAVYDGLVAAEGLERYLGARYVGQKRFSLEGGDALIPALRHLMVRATDFGVRDLVIGMAHRGRLNVLVNVLGKAPSDLFKIFEGQSEDERRSGDVKYHLGFSSDLKIGDRLLHLSLAFNPSHLEIVNPVVEGSVRARQDRRGDRERVQVLPVLIHGDAAFAGQGVVMETLNLSQARGYATGGTLHVVINNQIGFTTHQPLDARSTLYCTDVAKMVQAPVFHVNADDPEKVLRAMEWALDFRMRFHRDVVLDLVCYRRHGHNEADEPMITQPVMYQAIRAHATVRERYAQQLIDKGLISEQEALDAVANYRSRLEAGQPVAPHLVLEKIPDPYGVRWEPYLGHSVDLALETGVQEKTLKQLMRSLLELPQGFQLQAQLQREYDQRSQMARGELPLNWGFAELLAYASIVQEGRGLRFSGQDCGRGTFSHRHARVYDQKTGAEYFALANLATQSYCSVIDSVLSEEAVLGFEYGYAMSSPESLVIWEAQFGDFANGAQVIIDQFLSSGEQKWDRLCALVMLLPHGHEGQGPEHSSARPERYLQLCAEDNMQFCMPTLPSQMFHLLRRQVCQSARKPLVVMTPKAFLRDKRASSPLSALVSGRFEPVLWDVSLDPKPVKRVVFCSGKVYYDLLTEHEPAALKEVALVRVEQLYPWPEEALKRVLSHYSKAECYVWCQEEPMNQGAYTFIRDRLASMLPKSRPLIYAGRPEAAAPAVGSFGAHQRKQRTLVLDALGLSGEVS